MLVDIRVHGQPAQDTVRTEIQAAVQGHLGRFGADVAAVHVRITDVNGPRRGVELHASISVQGPRIGAITVEDLHEAPTLAVTGALDRIEHVVARDLERVRRTRLKPGLRFAAAFR